jgi:UDP-N-acetylmuramoyl-tripeptide--D-alanyl-D-alanine ligase
MLVELFSEFLIIVTLMVFASRRLLTYLHLFQQDEYDGMRFVSWALKNGVIDKSLSLPLLGAALVTSAIDLFEPFEFPFFITNTIVLALIAFAITKENDPRVDAKKKLSMTSRAKRIYIAALILILPMALLAFVIPSPWACLITIQFILFAMTLGNGILAPFEISVQNAFRAEAVQKLQTLSPRIIGITGSFGKTSIKHILGHVLKNHAPTLITPGSVNTPMGITRIIREELNDNHQFFIAEMGAYGPGSIERLCKLAPPSIGIISTIGHAHYERFKSLEAVAQTKFELAQAVIKNEGKVIVGEKTLSFPYTKDMAGENKESFIICGKNGDNELVIESIQQMPTGLDVRLRYKDVTHLLSSPLFGIHHGMNMVLAFVCAVELGIPAEDVARTIQTTPQIPHRLEVKRGPQGSFIIDDAYNSNPVGFQSALDLLNELGKKRRRILITPGMVELGKAHGDIHRQIGIAATRSCDIALIVNPSRIPTFIEGFKNEMTGNQALHEFATFDEAQSWMNENMQDSDVILIENDLPDLYERVPKL